jgi:hypothetical protein
VTVNPDTPVRPDESDEVRALRALAGIIGCAVTSTTGDAHARRSLHYAVGTNGIGRAADFASREGPGRDTSQLLAINEAVIRLIPLSMLSEVIYGGPGGICVKNGKMVNGMAVYGPTTMQAHHNHVHVGVIPGFRYQGSQEVVRPMADNDPNLPDIIGPVQLTVLFDNAGTCTGYMIFSEATGELHAFGPGARFYGRSEVVKLVGMPTTS